MMALPPLPAENEDPWFAKRNAFDLAVKGNFDAQGVSYPAAPISYASVQAACTAAAGNGTRVWAAGTITTSSTLKVTSDADLGGLTINYTGTGVAVQLGEGSTFTPRLKVTLPRVIAAAKTGPGWAMVAGTTGVYAINLDSCSEIVVPHIENFETGLLVYGKGFGCAYNTFIIGHLDNNKVNLKLSADATGWANQNTFVGGRYGHESAEGVAVAGARQIQMVAGLTHPINNNTWLNPSLEADTAEYIVDFAGTVNTIINGRFEATAPAVRWQANAVRNLILWGYNAHQLVQTYGAAASTNTILTNQAAYFTGADVMWNLENNASSGSPAMRIFAAGARAAGDAVTTAWAVALSANQMDFKRNTDAFARVRIDAQNTRVYFGNGAAAAVPYLGNYGSLGIAVNAGPLVFSPDNTVDVGQSAAVRPRHIYQAGYHDISEMTAPAAPPLNTARLFVQDNGAGKTQLMVRFPTGAAVQLAIEP